MYHIIIENTKSVIFETMHSSTSSVEKANGHKEYTKRDELANTKKGRTACELGKHAVTVTNAPLEKIGIPVHFKESLGKLRHFLGGRNSAAHESRHELARLLMLPSYLRYQGLYPVIYGETIEERAEGDDILDELL